MALWLIEQNKPVVLALAQALVDHPEHTLDAADIDTVIMQALVRACDGCRARARSTAWRAVAERAAAAKSLPI